MNASNKRTKLESWREKGAFKCLKTLITVKTHSMARQHAFFFILQPEHLNRDQRVREKSLIEVNYKDQSLVSFSI